MQCVLDNLVGKLAGWAAATHGKSEFKFKLPVDMFLGVVTFHVHVCDSINTKRPPETDAIHDKVNRPKNR